MDTWVQIYTLSLKTKFSWNTGQMVYLFFYWFWKCIRLHKKILVGYHNYIKYTKKVTFMRTCLAGTQNKVRTGKYLFYSTSIKNNETRICLIITTIFFMERKVEETNLILDMNSTHQMLPFIWAIERMANVLLNGCKDVNLAVNVRKTKYIKIGCHQEMA